ASLSTSQQDLIEQEVRDLIERHRESIPCKGCKRVKTLTFSKDRCGRLRIQCQGKDPACNVSTTAAKFLEWAKTSLVQHLPHQDENDDHLVISHEDEEANLSHDENEDLSNEIALVRDDFPLLHSPSTRQQKRVHSTSPLYAEPVPQRSRLHSPLQDARDVEIKNLREIINILKDQNADLKSQLTTVITEVRALRESITSIVTLRLPATASKQPALPRAAASPLPQEPSGSSASVWAQPLP